MSYLWGSLHGFGDDIPLIWKENPKKELSKNLHKRIIDINILDYDFNNENNELDYTLFGIEFILEKQSESDSKNFFSIYNGLDQNEISASEIQVKNQIKRIKMTRYNKMNKL